VGGVSQLSAVIPPTTTYMVTLTGSGSISIWAELR
jgi:hypothetical protein